MALISRRHWQTGRFSQPDGPGTTPALYRSAGRGGAVGGAHLSHHDLRLDVTSERLSPLSPETAKILRD